MFSRKAAAFITVISTVFSCIGAYYAEEAEMIQTEEEYSVKLYEADSVPELYANSEMPADYLMDELDNLSKVYDYTRNSQGQIALKATGGFLDDLTCYWLGTNPGPSDIVYKIDNGIRDFRIWMAETFRVYPVDSQALFTFFVSNDGNTWTEIPPANTNKVDLSDNLGDPAYYWDYYEAKDLPGGTRYVKFRFYRDPTAQPNSDLWTPRLRRVELNCTEPGENYIEASVPAADGRKEDITDNIEITTKYFVSNIDASKVSLEPATAAVTSATITAKGTVKIQFDSLLSEMTKYKVSISDVADVYGGTFSDSVEFTTGRGVVAPEAWLTQNNAKLDALVAGTVTPVFSVDNRMNAKGEIMLMALVFTGDRLSGISCKHVTDINSGKSDITLNNITIDSVENTKVKLYALTNPGTMNPVTGITEITSEGVITY